MNKLEIIEKKYGKDYGIKSDKKLKKYLRKLGYPSLANLLGKDRDGTF